MSDMGAILARIQVDAEAAVGGIVVERGIRQAKNLLTEELPHLFLFDPAEEIDLLPLQVEHQKFAARLELVTRGETQEATALKMDAIRDAIRGDRTLNGLVTWAYVSNRGIVESGETKEKIGEMIVLAENTGGSVFSYEIDVELKLVRTTTLDVYLSALEVTCTSGPTSPIQSFERLSSDYVLNRDSAEAWTNGGFQIQGIQVGVVRDSNDNFPHVAIKVLVYKYLLDSDTERDYTEVNTTKNLVFALHKFMDTEWWRAQSLVDKVVVPPSLTLDGDVGREV